MALKKCKECKKEVSDKAKTCPHCGVSNPGASAKELVVGTLAVIAIVWGVSKFIGDGDDNGASVGTPDSTVAQSMTTTPSVSGDEHAPITAGAVRMPDMERFTVASDAAFAAAQQHIQQLDQALERFEAILRHGDLKGRSEQSKRLDELTARGQRLFGDSVFEPLGYCYTASTRLRAFWHEHMAAQQRGAEIIQGSLQRSHANYKQHREECLRIANPATPTKPKNGCLITYGVNPETKKVEALPRPEHCK